MNSSKKTKNNMWKSTGKKVTVSLKGADGKMHKVSRTTYKNPSKPGEVRISRTGADGKRQYVKFSLGGSPSKASQRGGVEDDDLIFVNDLNNAVYNGNEYVYVCVNKWLGTLAYNTPTGWSYYHGCNSVREKGLAPELVFKKKGDDTYVCPGVGTLTKVKPVFTKPLNEQITPPIEAASKNLAYWANHPAQ
jgi:hypothetical protein